MPWVEFKSDYDWKPRSGITIGYLEGMKCNVTRTCAERAVAGGKAVRVYASKKVDDGNVR